MSHERVKHLKIKLYVEYKVEENMLEIYLENIKEIISFYKQFKGTSIKIYRSQDDLNRFVEECIFDIDNQTIEISLLKNRRSDFHEKRAEYLGLQPINIYTFVQLTIK